MPTPEVTLATDTPLGRGLWTSGHMLVWCSAEALNVWDLTLRNCVLVSAAKLPPGQGCHLAVGPVAAGLVGVRVGGSPELLRVFDPPPTGPRPTG